MQIDGELKAAEVQFADTILRERKSWKTMKGKSEPVWPPHLEKALIQALLLYNPNNPCYSRALDRFPKRNRFISDFIFEQTGVRRSPKQVGSRLQQLKDVSSGRRLLEHVANKFLDSNSVFDSGSSNSNEPDTTNSQTQDGSLPGPSKSSLAHLSPASSAGDNISPPPDSSPYSPSSPGGSPSITAQVQCLDILITFDPSTVPRAGTAPQPLKHFAGCLARPETVFASEKSISPLALANMEPSVTFTSRHAIAAQSVTTVWVQVDQTPDGCGGSASTSVGNESMGLPSKIHQHSQPLVCIQSPATMNIAAMQSYYSINQTDGVQNGFVHNTQTGDFVYKAQLFEDATWNALCWEMGDLSKYTITQELICNFDNSPVRIGQTFLYVTYHFVPVPLFSSTKAIHLLPETASSAPSAGLYFMEHANATSQLHPHSSSYQATQGQIEMQQQQQCQTQVFFNSGLYEQVQDIRLSPEIAPTDAVMMTAPTNVPISTGSDGDCASARLGMTHVSYAPELSILYSEVEAFNHLASSSLANKHLGPTWEIW